MNAGQWTKLTRNLKKVTKRRTDTGVTQNPFSNVLAAGSAPPPLGSSQQRGALEQQEEGGVTHGIGGTLYVFLIMIH